MPFDYHPGHQPDSGSLVDLSLTIYEPHNLHSNNLAHIHFDVCLRYYPIVLHERQLEQRLSLVITLKLVGTLIDLGNYGYLLGFD